MFDEIKDVAKKIIKSRLFVLALVMVILFAILLNRVFTLQIVNGAEYADKYTLIIEKEQTTTGTRGNIYDRNGKLLAYNELSYTVTIEDSGTYNGRNKNAALNRELSDLIQIIEAHGDSIVNDFPIYLNEAGEFATDLTKTALMRFRADVYGYTKIEELYENKKKLGYEESEATPKQMIDFLRSDKKFSVRLAGTDTLSEKDKKNGHTLYEPEEALKIITLRYALSQNNYRRYIGAAVAEDVSLETVAAIRENSDRLEGVDVVEDTVRVYADSMYFANIVGYTGKISQEEYEDLSGENEEYTLTDIVGKSGIEKEMETVLQGSKGYEKFYVDNVGRIVEMKEYEEASAGNDVYLSIDADLQIAVYKLLEQQIAGVVYSKIRDIKEYDAESGGAADIVIPIDDVYFALLNHNVIDIGAFAAEDASSVEKEVYQSFLTRLEAVLSDINSQLNAGNPTPHESLTPDRKAYMIYIADKLQKNGILNTEAVNKKDEVYLKWAEGSISLSEYLRHAISEEWIDITGFETASKYSDSLEIYDALLAYIEEMLTGDEEFSKLVYKYMIRDELVTGRQICQILFEQELLEFDEEDYNGLVSGAVDPYEFMREKIKNLEITPAQLALDPCTGSSVIINPQTGEVLACVSYPGYDSNRLANNMDSEYFKSLNQDTLTTPMYSKATQEKTAPGSTYKPVVAAAALTEGYITPETKIEDKGKFELVEDGPKCWLYPNGTHGEVNVSEAIRDSCNYFFYTLGYNMSLTEEGIYQEQKGIDLITKYAKMFGLGEATGIEVPENDPEISEVLPIPSAIGQGENNYTTSELARYTAAIASSGKVYNLTLLDKIAEPDGTLIKDYGPTVKDTMTAIAPDTWDAIHTGMLMMIQENSAFKGFDPSVAVAGKTGTAQMAKNRPNHALFIGYAPYDNPTLAIATRISFGYTSANAAAASRDIMEYYFNLTDKSLLLDGKAADVSDSANSFTD